MINQTVLNVVLIVVVCLLAIGLVFACRGVIEVRSTLGEVRSNLGEAELYRKEVERLRGQMDDMRVDVGLPAIGATSLARFEKENGVRVPHLYKAIGKSLKPRDEVVQIFATTDDPDEITDPWLAKWFKEVPQLLEAQGVRVELKSVAHWHNAEKRTPVFNSYIDGDLIRGGGKEYGESLRHRAESGGRRDIWTLQQVSSGYEGSYKTWTVRDDHGTRVCAETVMSDAITAACRIAQQRGVRMILYTVESD